MLCDFFQQRLVMAGHDDVVVADGVGEEIGGLRGVGEADDLLCATQVGLRLVVQERSFCKSRRRSGHGRRP